jgi:hypothetical protein
MRMCFCSHVPFVDEDSYREIRIENELRDEHGERVKLKKGAHVDVILEADKSDTVPKED